jgi:hypothetical protein
MSDQVTAVDIAKSDDGAKLPRFPSPPRAHVSRGRHSLRVRLNSSFNRTLPGWPALAFMAIIRPVKRLEVAQIITSTQRYWLIVIDLPTVLCSLAILISSYPGAATIFPQLVRIMPKNDLCFVPHSVDSDQVETAAIPSSAGLSEISVHLSSSLIDCSSLGRIRIIAVTVAFADLTVTPVNQNLDAVALGGPTTRIDGAGLPAVMRRIALRAFPHNGPPAVARDDVNVFLRHLKTSFLLLVS